MSKASRFLGFVCVLVTLGVFTRVHFSHDHSMSKTSRLLGVVCVLITLGVAIVFVTDFGPLAPAPMKTPAAVPTTNPPDDDVDNENDAAPLPTDADDHGEADDRDEPADPLVPEESPAQEEAATILAGRVVDAITEAPLEDAIVAVRWAGPGGGRGLMATRQARTGEDGRFEVTLPRGGEWHVEASATRRHVPWRSTVHVEADKTYGDHGAARSCVVAAGFRARAFRRSRRDAGGGPALAAR